MPDVLLDICAQNRELEELNSELSTQVSGLKGEVDVLAHKLKQETERVNAVWHMSCEQVSTFDEAVSAKDAEIDSLKARVVELEASQICLMLVCLALLLLFTLDPLLTHHPTWVIQPRMLVPSVSLHVGVGHHLSVSSLVTTQIAFWMTGFRRWKG